MFIVYLLYNNIFFLRVEKKDKDLIRRLDKTKVEKNDVDFR